MVLENFLRTKSGESRSFKAKLMRQFSLHAFASSLIAFACLSSAQAEAYNNCVPCEPYMTCDQINSCQERSCGRFFKGFDLLYWKPHIGSLELDFGHSNVIKETEESTIIIHSDEYDVDPHFRWNPGYRCTSGYQFACSPWEISNSWTHFHGKGSRDCSEESCNRGKCRLKFDQVDLVTAYNTNVGCSLSVKPFLGVRWASIRNKIHSVRTVDIEIRSIQCASETKSFRDHQNYHGIGPVLGVSGDWDMKCGFGFYGTLATSVLYGHHKIEFNDSDVFSAPVCKEIYHHDRRRLHTVDWGIDLAMGLRWETCLCDRFQLSLMLGYEHHEHFDYNQLGSECSDLSLDGATFSLNLAF